MLISLLVAIYFEIIHPALGLPLLPDWQRLCLGVAVTTAGWLAATFIFRPTEKKVLMSFYSGAFILEFMIRVSIRPQHWLIMWRHI